jgi:Tol biopolymer transport system component
VSRVRFPRVPGAAVGAVRSLAAGALAAGVLVAGGCGGSSSHGDAIAFVSTRDGDYALYAMNADGSDQGRITKEQGDTSTPAGATFQIDPEYAPDGKTIAFASARAGTLDLYLMDADGSDTRRLTTTVGNQSEPTWSPDGSQIAYQSDENGDHIYVMQADGTGAHRLTKDLAPEIEPAWSPDGAWIAYSRRLPGTEVREIWISHPDGTGRRRLTAVDGVAYAPAWSPDGKTIAFSTQQGTSHYEIATVGLDGKGLRTLTRSTEDAFEPAWSPDGKTLAFSRAGSIVTIAPDGSSPQVLTDPDGNDSSPDWNPHPGEGEEQS